MQLVVLGLNHKTAPVEVRERFYLTEEEIYIGLKSMSSYEKIREIAILATCNRTEIYAVIEESRNPSLVLKSFLYDLAGYEDGMEEYLYFYLGRECVKHLFKVASSLDSLIVGEGQILSQVKKAYIMALEAGNTSTVLNILFHRTIALGKKVRTETKIAHNSVSVSSAAVELARDIFADLSQIKALIIGAGKMGELIVTGLKARGCREIFVANRDFERAQKLAAQFAGQPLEFSRLLECAEQVDLIITSTGSTYYIVKEEEMREVMQKRPGKQLVLIDIAVPRDVDPKVAELSGVNLYNIDELKQVVQDNIKIRSKEAFLAEKIIEEETELLLERFRYLSFQPVISLLAKRAERMREREVKKAFGKLPELSAEEQRVLENMSRTLVRKLLREPMRTLNDAAGTKNEEYYVQALRRLFNLNTIVESVDEKQAGDWHKEQQVGAVAGQSYQDSIAK